MPGSRLDRTEENREREQYFFDDASIDWTAALARRYARPCLLCLPGVAQHLADDTTLLDLDERFADLDGFRRWDLTRPTFVPGDPFDLVLADPPFFTVSLRQLTRAVATLTRHVPTVPVALTYLERRADAVERAFADIHLRRTDHRATYRHVEAVDRNTILWFANFDLPDR